MSRRTRCRGCRARLSRRDRGCSRCSGCREVQRIEARHRRARARTSIVQLRELHAEARRLTLGRAGTNHQPDRARKVSQTYERMLRARGILVTATNEPPPGWSVEADIREEWLSMSEHLAMRRLG